MLRRGAQAGAQNRMHGRIYNTWTVRGGSRDGSEVATLTGSPIRIISVDRCARECSSEHARENRVERRRGQSWNQAYWSIAVSGFSRFVFQAASESPRRIIARCRNSCNPRSRVKPIWRNYRRLLPCPAPPSSCSVPGIGFVAVTAFMPNEN